MTKLSQIVYLHKGVAQVTEQEWTAAYKLFQKGDLYFGFKKEHNPLEGQLQRQPEERRVQANATAMISDLIPRLTRLFDLTATKDMADTTAFADVLVDDDILLPAVPIAHLLWLEKKLTELLATARALPVLSAAEDWKESDSLDAGVRKTDTETVDYTAKVRAHKILVPADKFPAQVDQWTEDVKAGETHTVKYSAALPPKVKADIVARVVKVLEGVKQAIPIANQVEVTDVSEGGPLFVYIFANLL